MPLKIVRHIAFISLLCGPITASLPSTYAAKSSHISKNSTAKNAKFESRNCIISSDWRGYADSGTVYRNKIGDFTYIEHITSTEKIMHFVSSLRVSKGRYLFNAKFSPKGSNASFAVKIDGMHTADGSSETKTFYGSDDGFSNVPVYLDHDGIVSVSGEAKASNKMWVNLGPISLCPDSRLAGFLDGPFSESFRATADYCGDIQEGYDKLPSNLRVKDPVTDPSVIPFSEMKNLSEICNLEGDPYDHKYSMKFLADPKHFANYINTNFKFCRRFAEQNKDCRV